jgi:hypothetical protein
VIVTIVSMGPLGGVKLVSCGVTRKFTLLESGPEGVTTTTGPVVAPAGMVVAISELETTVKVAAVPLNVTLVAPVRSVPRILTAAPTFPEAVWVSTNGPRAEDATRPGRPYRNLAFPAFRAY